MALNTDKNLKLYYSIKEVAGMIGVSESMLRFWEKEIPMLKPKTTGNNVCTTLSRCAASSLPPHARCCVRTSRVLTTTRALWKASSECATS